MALAAFVVTAAVVARDAAALARYPWDWAPDEGLFLDYARRLTREPATLYSRELIPFPMPYTPLLPLLLAPVVRATEAPLLPARLLAIAWTLAAAGATALLVRRRGSVPLALASSALLLAAGDLAVWFLMVRLDGLMVALWLLAAACLLPARLEPGADRLSRVRLWSGALLLVASVMAKPTAVLHGAPLVAGWLYVDRRSGFRLVAAVTSLGLLGLAVLQVASDGGFLSVMRLYGVHTRHPGLLWALTAGFLSTNAAYLAFALAGGVACWRSRGAPGREAAWLLVAGGLLIVPALVKRGAWTNYLLPLFCALVILAGRLWGSSAGGRRAAGTAVAGALAMVTLAARPLPLPTREDETTARAFYAAVQARGGPLLATRPEYAYYVLGQSVESEGSGFTYLVAARMPGTQAILDRVRRAHYRLIVAVWYFWPRHRDYEQALDRRYAAVARCSLRFFYGATDFVLFVPTEDRAAFVPPTGGRCRPL